MVSAATPEKPKEQQDKKSVKKQTSPVKPSSQSKKAAPAEETTPKAAREAPKETTDEELLKILGEKEEGELCLVATVVGCREFKDRIEFAMWLKDYVLKSEKARSE